MQRMNTTAAAAAKRPPFLRSSTAKGGLAAEALLGQAVCLFLSRGCSGRRGTGRHGESFRVSIFLSFLHLSSSLPLALTAFSCIHSTEHYRLSLSTRFLCELGV